MPEPPEAAFQKPERFAPTLPMPDELPLPVLKKPDDGTVVEFPKPGAAGMWTIGILMGPMEPGPLSCRTELGEPRVPAIDGRSM